MPRHNFARPRGQLVELTLESKALAGNALGDPSTRSCAVYLPPGYDPDAPGGFPLFVALAAFGGTGFKLLNWQSFGESLPQRLDRLIESGAMGPVVLALPDGFTRLGGNQWVNSAVLGDWETHVLDELVPALEDRFNVSEQPEGGPVQRAVFGHSSGGYAALIHAMRHGDRWGAAASHSGDVGFELVYGREFPGALAELARFDDAGAFLEKLWASDKIRGRQFNTLMLLAMAATYAPEADAPYGARLPVDPRTCARDRERWARWLAHDPLELVEAPGSVASMKRLASLYLDCGFRDEYFIHFGTRALVAKLEAAGVPHLYEEFDGGHSGVSHRLDRSLPRMYRALRPGADS
ncbi:enterochelin esterase [Plesiocystis pacifica SIR-1]|uniref:Enterochelin esterase n=1 Tax=Plesiocystis pacifica SIR-1 TaxID=391625 RepID=A6GK11_9BACT|nr:alpha/beta hydrolase-fold protein [Plesiocystis pacifica]EDM73793.1 enterochelin esterase [Plesiocystis pacifica SIR-1]